MSKQHIERSVVEGEGGRLDKYLARTLTGHSRSALQKLIADGVVSVNGQPAKASQQVESGDEIIYSLPDLQSSPPCAEAIPLDVIYEDHDLLVVNKPAGMVVHPAAGHARGTLVNALLARFPELARLGGARPGVVHRLDRDTSGLVVVAKSDAALASLQSQFRSRKVEKVYLALLDGMLQPERGVIDAPIGRNPRQRQRMAVVTQGGKPARTAYRVREHLGQYSFVEARPETGRTHQIRVHFAAIGYPVVGDPVYGRRKQPFKLRRQFLHAWELTFSLLSGERRMFTAPLPADLQQVLDRLAG